MIKVAVIGPESTGKSTLATYLAQQLSGGLVPEYARDYLQQLGRPYTEADLLSIAKGQCAAEDYYRLSNDPPPFLICDTELTVIKIWSEVKYSRVHPWILTELKQRSYDFYLLTYIDLPWEADPLREHPYKREFLFDLYLKECQNRNLPFALIKGSKEERQAQAEKILLDLKS